MVTSCLLLAFEAGSPYISKCTVVNVLNPCYPAYAVSNITYDGAVMAKLKQFLLTLEEMETVTYDDSRRQFIGFGGQHTPTSGQPDGSRGEPAVQFQTGGQGNGGGPIILHRDGGPSPHKSKNKRNQEFDQEASAG